MKGREFEDLNVYQRARELTNRIYDLTRGKAFAQDPGLTNQMRRAAVSVISNIAEGFERGSNAEFVQFLFISKGSCGELRAQLSVAFDQRYISKKDWDGLADGCRRISAMLANLISYLRQPRLSVRRSHGASRKSLTEELNHLITEPTED